MTLVLFRRLLPVALLLLVSSQPIVVSQVPAISAASADDLVGLWGAKKRFGPDARGTLTIQRTGATYSADMAGRIVPVRMERGELVFDLPGGQGTFRGKFQGQGGILGHWIQPATVVNFGETASRVILKQDGRNRWRGIAEPLQDEFTFYLRAEKGPDGSLNVLLRNVERDVGARLGSQLRLTREGNVVKLIGKPRGQTEDRVLASGPYDSDNQVFTFTFPERGGSYDFRREGDESNFYRRGKNPGPYSYTPPPALYDGWSTGSLEDVGIDRAGMEKVMQMVIDTPEGKINTPQIHSLLIARHGKLVLEEYFHGYDRETPHTTRSASKSVTATIIGAAMQNGAPLRLSSPVYQVMNGGTFPADLEPAKRAMTLEHLLTMSSGIFCDDNNENAPGNENGMWNQTEEPDFYRFYMKAPMDRKPGEKAVYCSGDANLALGMVGRAAGEDPMYTFDRLIGEPMKITRYGWGLDRVRQPYGGGGMQLLPRDFLKFGQLMLNGGTWDGHRILSRDFVARATTNINMPSNLGNRKYGYLWWGDHLAENDDHALTIVQDFTYKGSTLHSFAAYGAGGQTVLVIPELDLVFSIFNGNFASGGWVYAGGELIPKYILPTVREAATIRKNPKRNEDQKMAVSTRAPRHGLSISPRK